ncbi:MAG: PLP-dependent aminotransferase family protein [Oscillospiraceae bacterium]|jgi:2-aminoadipate transaminase|nr:PLP-dependent aminotransferase family protein [Oscillospiraceae bacterium]
MEFSRRISSLRPSAIREILKAPSDADTVTLAAGNPSPEAFPAEEMAALAAEIFATGAASALQYGISEGYGPLRERTRERILQKHGIGTESDDLIITSGGQQVVELAAKTLLNEGDTVICEDPSFIGALNALRSYGVKLAGVPCGGAGMDISALERAFINHPEAKMVYTIPTFQNPAGEVMPLAARKRLLELAARHNVMILEDDPYRELRYDGEDVPAIKSLDTEGRVIYAGSFSKIIAPGIRLGFALAPAPLIAKMTAAKQVSDVHSNLFFQILVERYMARHDLDAHIARCRALYKTRRDCMDAALKRHLPDAEWIVPEGGLFIWVKLPDGMDGTDFCRRAKERKVMAVPGSAFLCDEEGVSGAIRLNFSLPSLEQIETGVARLGETYKER